MNEYLLLICEGKNDEAVGSKLIERLVGEPGEVWEWMAGTERPKAFLYWKEWKDAWKSQSRRMRGTLSMPERIKRLRKHRGEAVMAVQVVHLAKTKVPKSSIILMRDSDGKEERLKAWMAFRQTNKSVIVGMAKKSVEAWVLACWDSDKEQIRDASTWIKQERGSEFDPFREPERLAPNLSKRLLEHYNCTCSDDYADVLTRATDAHIRSDAAKRAGLSQFVEQIEAKLAHIIDIETKQVSDAN